MRKSVFQESNSLGKAIEKAWEVAGAPKEFTIKVLEKGKYGFLGFGSKPFVISLFQEKDKDRENRKDQKKEFPKKASFENSNHKNSPHANDNRKQKNNKTWPAKNNNEKKPNINVDESEPTDIWNNEISTKAETLLQEIFNIASGKKIEMEKKSHGNTLNVTVSTPILENCSSERSFYVSVSSLVMYAIKKESNKDLRGLRLIISNK